MNGLLRHGTLRHGTLLLAGLMLVLAANVLSMGQAYALTPNQTTAVDVINTLYPYLDHYWRDNLTRNGKQYGTPDVKWYNYSDDSQSVYSHCNGWFTAAHRQYNQYNWTEGNSFYCHLDGNGTIYLDYSYHEWIAANLGDYYAGVLFAHEWSHHVQAWAHGSPNSQPNELQADCMAGAFTAYAANQGLLAHGDYEEGWYWLWYSTAGKDPSTHGTPELRTGWYAYGYQTGNPGSCNTAEV